MRIYSSIISALILFSCSNPEKEIYQSDRNNIINISDQLIDINFETNLLVGGNTVLYIIKDYLIVCDHQNPEKGIHLFNKNTFEYITSTGLKGEGPGEIIRYAHIGVDNENGTFYMTDYGKMAAFKFDLDSVLTNPDYKPSKSFSLIKDLFPATFYFVNDSTIMGKGLEIIDNRNFNSTIVSYNIMSDEIKKIGKPNPNINVKNRTTYFSVSLQHNLSVETFSDYDLMTIRDLEGKTIKHIYGPQWGIKEKVNNYYYITHFLADKIIASFMGVPGATIDNNKRLKAVFPTKLLIFDKNGKYLKTLETGYDIFHFCVDEVNNRIILTFQNRENQFAYIQLN